MTDEENKIQKSLDELKRDSNFKKIMDESWKLQLIGIPHAVQYKKGKFKIIK